MLRGVSDFKKKFSVSPDQPYKAGYIGVTLQASV